MEQNVHPTVSVLSFAIEPLEFPWGTDSKVVPLIDGRNFIDLVAEFERSHDFHMPGAYDLPPFSAR